MLDETSEDTLAREVWQRCDAARESFRLDRITVESEEQYEDILSRFMAHYAERAVFVGRLDPENPHLTAEEYLRKAYGSWMLPYECARSGELGGMKGILDSIHEYAKREATECYIEYKLEYFEIPERARLLQECIDKFGDDLRPQHRGQPAGWLYLDFLDMLRNHSRAIAPALRTAAEDT